MPLKVYSRRALFRLAASGAALFTVRPWPARGATGSLVEVSNDETRVGMSGATHSAEANLSKIGIQLPRIPEPGGAYVHAVQSGSLIFTAGHPPIRSNGSAVLGRLGQELSTEEGYQAARLSAAGVLATLRNALGSLDQIARIVRLYGVVNATPEFVEHTQVVNGASELFQEVFGETGRHARLAVGMVSLPYNIALEVEVVAEVRI